MSLFTDILKGVVQFTPGSQPLRDFIQAAANDALAKNVKRVEAPVYSRDELLNMGGSQNFLNTPEMKKYSEALRNSQNSYQALQQELANPSMNKLFNKTFDVAPEDLKRQTGAKMYGITKEKPRGELFAETPRKDTIEGISLILAGLTGKYIEGTKFLPRAARLTSNIAEGMLEGYGQSNDTNAKSSMLIGGAAGAVGGTFAELLDTAWGQNVLSKLDKKTFAKVRNYVETIKAENLKKAFPEVLEYLRSLDIDPMTGLKRTYAGSLELRPDAQVSAEQRLWSEVLENAKKPKLSEAQLEKTIRGTKGKLRGKDLGVELPNISTKRDVPIRDITGKSSIIKAGENLKPYTIQGKSQIYLRDGDTYIVPQSKFKDLLSNSEIAIKRPWKGEVINNYKWLTKSRNPSYRGTNLLDIGKEDVKLFSFEDILRREPGSEADKAFKSLKGNDLKNFNAALKSIEREDYLKYRQRYVVPFIENDGKYSLHPEVAGRYSVYYDTKYSGEPEDILNRLRSKKIGLNFEPTWFDQSGYRIQRPWVTKDSYTETLLYDKRPRTKPYKKLPEGFTTKQLKDLTPAEINKLRRIEKSKGNDIDWMKNKDNYVVFNQEGFKTNHSRSKEVAEREALEGVNNRIEKGFIESHFSDDNKEVYNRFGLENISHGRTQDIEFSVPENGKMVKKKGMFFEENQQPRKAAIKKGRDVYLLPRPDTDIDGYKLQIYKQIQDAVDRKMDYMILNSAEIQRPRNRVTTYIRDIEWTEPDVARATPVEYKGKKLTIPELDNLKVGETVFAPSSIIDDANSTSIKEYYIVGRQGFKGDENELVFDMVDKEEYAKIFYDNFPGRRKVVNIYDYNLEVEDDSVVRSMKKQLKNNIARDVTNDIYDEDQLDAIFKDKETIKKALVEASSGSDLKEAYYAALDKKYKLRKGSIGLFQYETQSSEAPLRVKDITPETKGFDFDKIINVHTTEGGEVGLYVKDNVIVDVYPSSNDVDGRIIGRNLSDYLNDEGLSQEIASKKTGSLWGDDLNSKSTWVDKFYGRGGRDEQFHKEALDLTGLEELEFPIERYTDLKRDFEKYITDDEIIKGYKLKEDVDGDTVREFRKIAEEEMGGNSVVEGPDDIAVGDIFRDKNYGDIMVAIRKQEDGGYILSHKHKLDNRLKRLSEGKYDKFGRYENVFEMSEEELEKLGLSKKKLYTVVSDLEHEYDKIVGYFKQPVEEFRAYKITDNIARKVKGKAQKFPVSKNLFEEYIEKSRPGKAMQALQSMSKFPETGGYSNVKTKLAADFVKDNIKKGVIKQSSDIKQQIINLLRENDMVGKDINIGQILQRILE